MGVNQITRNSISSVWYLITKISLKNYLKFYLSEEVEGFPDRLILLRFSFKFIDYRNNFVGCEDPLYVMDV